MTATGWPRCGRCDNPARHHIAAGTTARMAQYAANACDPHLPDAQREARHWSYRETRAAQPGDDATTDDVEQDALFDLDGSAAATEGERS